jgi:cytochrome c oxidase assembly factor CtaG
MLSPFGFQAVFTHWQFAPVVTVATVLAATLYLWGVIRVARRHPARPWPAWRTGMFLGGLAVVALALQSGIGVYDDTLFWDHMIQHLMLVMAAPPLLIFGQPITLLMHASRNPLHTWVKRAVRSKPASFLTWPVFGFAAYAAASVVAHLTGVANLTATNEAAHEAEHVAFLVIGYLFFLPIIGSEPIKWKLSYPTKLVLLFLVMPVDTFTGLVLTYGNRSTPGLVTGPRPGWAGTAVGDLHAGGAVMWVGGDAIMFALMMVVFLMWSTDTSTATRNLGWLEAVRRTTVGHAPTATTANGAAAADIDDDEEQLAAYNAYLKGLHEPAGNPRQDPRHAG